MINASLKTEKVEKALGKTKIPSKVDPIVLADEIKGDLTAEWREAKRRLEVEALKVS